MKTRKEILEAEFVRAPRPGLRLFGAGMFVLFNQLRLNPDVPLDTIAVTWLLDERNDLDRIREQVERGREYVFAEVLPEYLKGVVPLSLMALAKEEIAAAGAAVDEILYVVTPKPGDKPGPAPPGN